MRSEPGPRRIWVTRAQPGAEATASRLRDLGFEPVVAPVLETRAIAGAVIDLTGVDALAFTSAAGVAAFAAIKGAPALPVFAVGDATAEAARAAGFADVRSAQGDARALAEMIAAAHPRPASILGPTAAEPAADLAGLLADRGVRARSAIVYQTVEVAAGLAPTGLSGILIHSPKAARAIAARLGGADVSAIALYALSAAAAAPLADLAFRKIAMAAAPNEAALLALLET
jgi:uroporphyrinogen-III synthase